MKPYVGAGSGLVHFASAGKIRAIGAISGSARFSVVPRAANLAASATVQASFNLRLKKTLAAYARKLTLDSPMPVVSGRT